MKIEKILVIGAGQMGSGIAQTAASAGFGVYLHDIDMALIERGIEGIGKNLGKQVTKGKLSEEEKAAILGRIKPAPQLADGKDADIAIEAAIEKMEVKKEIFRTLDHLLRPEAILASNTSSLPITELAGSTNRPGQVIGMHFMNPVPVMKLVEVIRALTTEEKTYAAVVALAKEMGKEPVEVRDFPGFVSNRVLMPMINEAIYAVYEGVATPEAVDQVMKLGMNHPMGPLELADFIGLDTCLYIMEVLHEGFGDSKYRPCPLLRKYVEAGWLGKKTGKGFYTYES